MELERLENTHLFCCKPPLMTPNWLASPNFGCSPCDLLNIFGECKIGLFHIYWVVSMEVAKPEHLMMSEFKNVIGVSRFFQKDLKVDWVKRIIVSLVFKSPVNHIRVNRNFRCFLCFLKMPVELNPSPPCQVICFLETYLVSLGMWFHSQPPNAGVLAKPQKAWRWCLILFEKYFQAGEVAHLFPFNACWWLESRKSWKMLQLSLEGNMLQDKERVSSSIAINLEGSPCPAAYTQWLPPAFHGSNFCRIVNIVRSQVNWGLE